MVPLGIIVVGKLFCGLDVKAMPLQALTVCVGKSGVGLTVTTTVNGVPAHEPAAPEVGVTV